MTDIDTDKPNAARIYDYMLGGSHNFEADRAAGERLLKFFPSMRNGMRSARWFMHDVVERMTKSDFHCYLDLASGVPTEGYVHELSPHAKVLYNDRDPVTVAYARQILGDNPNVRYNQSDLNNIEDLLQEASSFLDRSRPIGICFVGVAYFLEDAVVQQILDHLYAWAPPGSELAMTWLIGDPENPLLKEMLDTYEKIGASLTFRSPDAVRALISKWSIQEPGLIRISEWLALDGWHEQGSTDTSAYEPWGVLLRKD
jgi:O-methyltransferase involved in polyketide biosynthesis